MQAPPASELSGPSALAQNTIVTSPSSGGNVPTGAMTLYISATPPSGWLICDGTAISRTTYATLFTVLGSTYGSGDGSTTFNLPDLRGRVPVGQGTNASVSALNANDGQALANRRPHHRTTDAKTVAIGTLGVNDPGHGHTIGGSTGGGAGGPQIGGSSLGNGTGVDTNTAAVLSHTTGVTLTGSPTLGGTIGSNVANDALDTPSFVVVSYIIKT